MTPIDPSSRPVAAFDPSRRSLLVAGAASALLGACAARPGAPERAPIVFMHGNGDSAAVWTTTLWRFESSGWPIDRLFTVDVPYPLARDDDNVAQPGHSSTADNRAALAQTVQRALRVTGARRVVLIASSRGGNAVRDYIAHDAGVQTVSHAILCGTPNHGVFADPLHALGSEFNGAGAFLSALNAPDGPHQDEVTPGVRWMTIRSDHNDKYAQSDGAWIGRKGQPTNVTYDGPALKGAENVVLAGADHRETAFSAGAFAQMWRFLTGENAPSAAVVPQSRVVLDGMVFGSESFAGLPAVLTNRPQSGASVEVFATDADTGQRLGPAVHRRTVGPDGRWGPLAVASGTTLEFVVAAPGHATTHIYRSAFPRSSPVTHLRAERTLAAQSGAAAVVSLSRPRGYFDLARDRIALDGHEPPAGIPPGVAGVSQVSVTPADAPGRSVVGVFNGERIAAWTWPAARDELTVMELTG